MRPYQDAISNELCERKIGFFLTEERSGKKLDKNGNPIMGKDPKTKKEFPLFWPEENFTRYYFTKDFKIYSDKIAKFIFECNKKMNGEVIKRLSRIYPNIFIDEVQDLAGWELEIIKLLFKSSANILLVGDPRQITYLTHHPIKNTVKAQSNKEGYLTIESFIKKNKLDSLCPIDSDTLKNTHRNNKIICDYSSKLFPDYEKSEPCKCSKCRSYQIDHEGVFLVKSKDIEVYCKKYNPTILKWSGSIYPEWNFGKSKGLTFLRVLIYPAKVKNGMIDWIKNNNTVLNPETRSKFYVAITRAKYSVGIVYDYAESDSFDGVEKYIVEKEV